MRPCFAPPAWASPSLCCLLRVPPHGPLQAFRKFYDVVGLGWVYAATKLKPVGGVCR